MPKEPTEKFLFKLRWSDMRELEKFLGPWCRNKWWYREWLRRYAHEVSPDEYGALAEAARALEAAAVGERGEGA